MKSSSSAESKRKPLYITIGGFRLGQEKTIRLRYQTVVLCLFFILCYLLFQRSDAFFHHILEDFAQTVSDRSGMSLYTVKGELLIATIPFFYVVAIQSPWDLFCDAETVQVSKTGGKALLLLVVTAFYLGLAQLLFGYVSREAYAYKFCADIPEDVVTSDVAGGKEHLYGHPFHPCSPQEIRFLRNKHDHSLAASEVQISDWRHIHWKDAGSGAVILWYSKRLDGYHFFNHSGTDPEGGTELSPANQSVVTQYQAEQLKQTNAVQDALLLVQARKMLDNGDFDAAIQACATVSAHNPSEPCDQITHDASVLWAHKVVDQGQGQLQHAQYDAAIRSAKQAIQLDPDNVPAKDLLQVATSLKSQASVD